MHQTRWSLSLCNQEGEWCDFIDLNEAPHVTLINGNKAYHILSMGCTYSEIDADFFSWQRLVVLFFSWRKVVLYKKRRPENVRFWWNSAKMKFEMIIVHHFILACSVLQVFNVFPNRSGNLSWKLVCVLVLMSPRHFIQKRRPEGLQVWWKRAKIHFRDNYCKHTILFCHAQFYRLLTDFCMYVVLNKSGFGWIFLKKRNVWKLVVSSVWNCSFFKPWKHSHYCYYYWITLAWLGSLQIHFSGPHSNWTFAWTRMG